MYTGLAWSVLLSLLTVSVTALYESSELITSFTHDAFKKEVTGTDVMWILAFHSPNCLSCEDFVPQFQDVAAKLAPYGVKAGAIDCEDQKRICEDLNVVTAPYFKFYSEPTQRNPYTHKRYRVAINYKGKLDGKSLEKFVLKNIFHDIKPATESNYTNIFNTAQSSNKNLAILFTERDQTSPLYKTVSNALHKKLTFAEVNIRESSLISRYGINKLPQIGVVTAHDDKFHAFEGDTKNVEEIISFMNEFAMDSPSLNMEDGPLIAMDQLEARVSAGGFAWLLVVSDDGSSDGFTDWQKIVKKCQGVVHAGRIQCDKTESFSTEATALCEKIKQDGPQLLVIPYNSKEYTQFFAPNAGDVALKTVMASLPSNVPVLSEAALNTFLTQAHSRRKLALVAVSDKDTVPSLLKNVALTVASYADVAVVTSQTPQFLEGLQIKKLPTILCAVPGVTSIRADGTPEQIINVLQYGGRLVVNDLAQFVTSQFANSKFGANANEQSSNIPEFESTSSTNTAAARNMATFEQIQKDNWDELCPSSASAICAIAFVGGEGDISQQSHVLEQVMNELNAGRSSSPFKFMWADANCLQTFADGFDVQYHKLPTIVAFSPRRMRVANMLGVYNPTNVRQFLEGVLHGSIATAPISQRPVPDAECAAIAHEDIPSDEEVEGMDDLMEEIRREEAAEKQRMQIELEKERQEQEAAAIAARKAEEDKLKESKKANKKKKKRKNRNNNNSEL